MILALIALPAAAALAALLLRRPSPALLVGSAAAHLGLVAWAWADRGRFPSAGQWLAVDPLGLLFLAVSSALFLGVAVYASAFLARGAADAAGAPTAAGAASPVSGRAGADAHFTAWLLGFQAAMSLVVLSQHFGLMWVAVEATTLLSAPLIHYHRHPRSLEATWKYLLICSVGIAVALLGTFFLSAASTSGAEAVPLFFRRLGAARLDPQWLKAAFILLLVGYGTKMGLAPLHTWLPDAHSEAPSPVSALLSGALLNCAFLAILRLHRVCLAAGLGDFSRQLLLLLGLLSMAVAAAFILGQGDYKRLLAYSSVEHMGILAVGIGVGGDWGALFQALSHSLVKAALFLTAGNILAAYGTKKAAEVRGLLRALPWSGALWLAGFFAITGAPPFGTFVGELAILRAAFQRRAWLPASLFLLLLAVIFIGMASVFLRMAQGPREPAGGLEPTVGPKPGNTPAHASAPAAERPAFLAAPLAFLAAAAVLGLGAPRFLRELLGEALRGWGG
jgi:hydrogenase-4 component F